LRGEAYVNDATREAVLAAAQKLGYHPNNLARQLRSNTSHTIGFIVPDISNPFFAAVARGITSVLRRQGYDLIVYDTEGDAVFEQKAVSMLKEHKVDGLIISVLETEAETETGGLTHTLADSVERLVVVDNKIPGLQADGVFVDNFNGCKRLVEHLLALGHKRIALIGGPLNETSAAERLESYRQTLIAHNLYSEDLVRTGDFRKESGSALAAELMALAAPPQAIVCANNLMAVGALTAIRHVGLRIPDDVALVSFDDFDLADLLDPPLTTMAQPATDIGRQAAQLILSRLNKEYQGEPRTVVLQPTLIVRKSCGSRPAGLKPGK